MVKISKNLAKRIKSLVIAYEAYHQACRDNDKSGRKVWARIIRENKDIATAIDLNVNSIVAWIDFEDVKTLEGA